MTTSQTCVICNKQFAGYGHNPAPVCMNGRVCDNCNNSFVVPARLKFIEADRKW